MRGRRGREEGKGEKYEEREMGGEWSGGLGEVLFPAQAGIAEQVGMFLNTVQLCLREVVI